MGGIVREGNRRGRELCLLGEISKDNPEHICEVEKSYSVKLCLKSKEEKKENSYVFFFPQMKVIILRRNSIECLLSNTYIFLQFCFPYYELLTYIHLRTT